MEAGASKGHMTGGATSAQAGSASGPSVALNDVGGTTPGPITQQQLGHDNNWLGDFGEQWFATLCAAARLEVTRGRDRNGVDWFVQHGSGIQIRTQVKATEVPRKAHDGYRYWLERPRYEQLLGMSALANPGLFVLVVVHRRYPDWASHHGRGSVVRATAFWTWASDIDGSPGGQHVRIRLPWDNRLTPAVLQGLFDTSVEAYPWKS